MATYISKSKKEELVHLEIVAEEKSSGILIGGEFVGRGELLECDEQTAAELVRRGRAKLYVEGSKKKVDKTSEPAEEGSDEEPSESTEDEFEEQTEDKQE